MLKGGCEEERRGTQVEALDSLKPKKKFTIFLRPQAWLGPIPLVPSTNKSLPHHKVIGTRALLALKW